MGAPRAAAVVLTLACALLVPAVTALSRVPSAAGPAVLDDEVEDELLLADGKTVRGRVVYEDAEQVGLLVRNRVRTYDREDVAEVRSAARALATLLERLEQVPPDDLRGRFELAHTAREAGLAGEAELLLLGILLRDPDHAGANERLGHRERKGVWQRKHGRKWVDTADLATQVEDWGDRWVLTTRHYELRTNLPLPAALDAAWDLERILAGFMELLGDELALHDIVERMFVQVHADAKSYPQPTGGRRGYYEPGSRTLYVDATLGSEGRAEVLGGARFVLVHEGTHQLLHMTTQRTTKAKGSVPAWLDEGLAEYMKVALVGREGGAAFRFGVPAPPLFAAHATAEKPYDLNRMLTMETGDFLASAHVAQKYGQAYSLVHFSLHGDDGAHREGFLDFLRAAWEGKSSMTEFKRHLVLEPDDFEERWHAHARRHAGG